MSRIIEQIKNKTLSDLLLNFKDRRLGGKGFGKDEEPRKQSGLGGKEVIP